MEREEGKVSGFRNKMAHPLPYPHSVITLLTYAMDTRLVVSVQNGSAWNGSVKIMDTWGAVLNLMDGHMVYSASFHL